MLLFSHNKKRLLNHFEKDPILFGYHLGDLDDFYFDDCQWGVANHGRMRVEEVILVYTGLSTPTVLAFGLTDHFDQLLEEMLELLPRQFFGHYLKQYRPLLHKRFEERSLGAHYKMKLDNLPGTATSSTANSFIKLGNQHADELEQFYKRAYPDNYFTPRMLATGKYRGLKIDGKLAAVAGVHVYSSEYKIAVPGNIATAPDYRGHGYATDVTAALSKELVDEGLRVALNVKADNAPAIACYEKLGFSRVHVYEEGYFEQK